MRDEENITSAVQEMTKARDEYFNDVIDLATAQSKIKTIALVKGVDPKTTMRILRELRNN